MAIHTTAEGGIRRLSVHLCVHLADDNVFRRQVLMQNDEMNIDVITLPNGHIIKDCSNRLLGKYLDGPRSLVFDLYAAGQTPERRQWLSWVDAAMTESMNSGLGCEGWLRLAAAPVHMDALDPTWRFEDYPTHKKEMIDAYVAVHQALRLQPGASAQVFKLLALKWPRLFPMIDGKVGELFSGEPDGEVTAILEQWPNRDGVEVDTRWRNAESDPRLVAEFYLDEFSFLMRRFDEQKENQGKLASLSAWLGGKLVELVGVELNLAPIRVMESLVWIEAMGPKPTAGTVATLRETWTGADDGAKNSWRAADIKAYVSMALSSARNSTPAFSVAEQS